MSNLKSGSYFNKAFVESIFLDKKISIKNKRVNIKIKFCKVLLGEVDNFYLTKITYNNKDLFHYSGYKNHTVSTTTKKLNKIVSKFHNMSACKLGQQLLTNKLNINYVITELDNENMEDWVKTPFYTPLFYAKNAMAQPTENIECSPIFNLYFKLMYKDLKNKLIIINPTVIIHPPTKLINFNIEDTLYGITFFTYVKLKEVEPEPDPFSVYPSNFTNSYRNIDKFGFGFNIVDSKFNVIERHLIAGNELTHGRPIFNLSPATLNKRIFTIFKKFHKND